MASQIPIVDFSPWTSDTPSSRTQVALDLVSACQKVGFVQITNHGIASTRLAQAFALSEKLFNLPLQKKKLAPHPPGFAVHRGYSWPGLEKVSNAMGDETDTEELKKELRQVGDVKESYEIGSEANTDQPNQWLPEEVLPGFQDFTTAFYWECHHVAMEILSALALGLGLDKDYFRPMHSGNNNQLRLLHYPPVAAGQIESGAATRLGAHSDWPTMTLLFQDDCGGLQIENPHSPNTFIDVPPIKDALVMNIGDLLMRWSNDSLKSTIHRVNLPPLQDRFVGDERMTRERYSIPYFVSPEGPTIVECLPSCMGEGKPAKYEPIRWNDYMLMRASMQYEQTAPSTKEVEVGG